MEIGSPKTSAKNHQDCALFWAILWGKIGMSLCREKKELHTCIRKYLTKKQNAK